MSLSTAQSPEGLRSALLAEAEQHCRRALAEDALTRTARLAGARSEFWGHLWNWVLVRENVLTSRIIEACPDLDARVQVFGVIQREYGYPQAGPAHSRLLRDFLLKLGVPGEVCTWPLRRDAPDVQAELARIEGFGFIGLVAYGLVGWGILAKSVFPAIKQALLASRFGLTDEQVTYFDRVAGHGESEIEVGLKMVTRYATNAQDGERAFQALRSFFQSCPIAWSPGQGGRGA